MRMQKKCTTEQMTEAGILVNQQFQGAKFRIGYIVTGTHNNGRQLYELGIEYKLSASAWEDYEPDFGDPRPSIGGHISAIARENHCIGIRNSYEKLYKLCGGNPR